MKQIVADAAVKEVKEGMIIGLGSGSTAALMIKSLAEKIRSGKLKNIRGVPTSFQSEVLALELNIPLIDLTSVPKIDIAIDGADEVDPNFQLIKGGGACHVREKLVATKANKLLIVVDETKLVENLNKDSGLFDKKWEDNIQYIRNYCEETTLPPSLAVTIPLINDL